MVQADSDKVVISATTASSTRLKRDKAEGCDSGGIEVRVLAVIFLSATLFLTRSIVIRSPPTPRSGTWARAVWEGNAGTDGSGYRSAALAQYQPAMVLQPNPARPTGLGHSGSMAS